MRSLRARCRVCASNCWSAVESILSKIFVVRSQKQRTEVFGIRGVWSECMRDAIDYARNSNTFVRRRRWWCRWWWLDRIQTDLCCALCLTFKEFIFSCYLRALEMLWQTQRDHDWHLINIKKVVLFSWRKKAKTYARSHAIWSYQQTPKFDKWSWRYFLDDICCLFFKPAFYRTPKRDVSQFESAISCILI